MIPAKDLVPAQWSRESPWHDAGYDTAWVPADASASVFTGGKGWNQGHKEETCVWDASWISVLRRIDWDTDRADVNEIEWMWWEDSNRVAAHTQRVGEWVAYSRQNSIMIESHWLARSKGGQSEFVIRIEDGRKLFHEHTGLQYEINLAALTQTNVMTSFVRPLLRRRRERIVERMVEAAVKLESVARGWFGRRVAARKRKDMSIKRTCAAIIVQRAFRSCPRNTKKPILLIEDEQEIESGQSVVAPADMCCLRHYQVSKKDLLIASKRPIKSLEKMPIKSLKEAY